MIRVENRQHDSRTTRHPVKVAGRTRSLLVGLTILAALYTFYLARQLILPVVFAGFLALLLHPLVVRLRRLRLPDWLGAGLVLMGFTGLLGLAVYSLATPAAEWIDRIPRAVGQVERKLHPLKSSLNEATRATDEIEEIADISSRKSREVVVRGPSLAEKIFSETGASVATGALIGVLLFFLLSQASRCVDRARRVVPAGHRMLGWLDMVVEVQGELVRYLVTVTLINVALGALTALAMFLLGMPSPLLWGVLAALLNFAPYLGPAITLGVLGLVSLATFDGWAAIAAPPLVFLLLTGLEGQIVTPLILGRSMTLNPVAVFLSLLFWGWMWGALGVLMAVPILAAVKLVAGRTPSLRPLEAVLS